MNISKNMWWIIGGSGLAGLGIGIYFLVKDRKRKQDPMMLGRGAHQKPITIVSDGKGTPVVEPNWSAPFDMNYITDVKKYLRGKRIAELPTGTANTYIKKLKNAKGIFDDNEKAVGDVFRSLRDKTQVASLSKAFFARYQLDMYRYLQSFLSESEMKTLVIAPVRKLDNYTLA